MNVNKVAVLCCSVFGLNAGVFAELPAGRRVIVTINVANYQSPLFAKQRAPAKEGKDIPAYLALTPPERTIRIHLCDATGPRSTESLPTAANVRAIFARLVRTLDPNDELIVHIAGCGFESKLGPVFAPLDANPNEPSTMIPIRELATFLERVPARRKLFLVDACRNEIDVPVIQHRIDQPPDDSVTRPKELRRPGVLVVVQAASAGQYAWNCPKSGFGILTCQFQAGLSGEADANNDGEVTIAELLEFLKRSVPENSKAQGEQYPEVFDRSNDNWVLAQCAKKPTLSNDGVARSSSNIAPNTMGWDSRVTPSMSNPSAQVRTYGSGIQDRPFLQEAARTGIRYGINYGLSRIPR